MATDQQVEIILRSLNSCDPMRLSRRFNETQAGIGAVLRYLYETENSVTSGAISAFLGVSTARVAALLKKMEAKGLVIREQDLLDARVTVVRITELGRSMIEERKQALYREVAAVIDRLGMERLLAFAETLKEIQKTVKGPNFDF